MKICVAVLNLFMYISIILEFVYQMYLFVYVYSNILERIKTEKKWDGVTFFQTIF